MIEQLPVAEFVLATIITAVAGVAVAIVNAFERYKTVKLSLKKIKPKQRAEVIKATALLLEERRWFQRGGGLPKQE